MQMFCGFSSLDSGITETRLLECSSTPRSDESLRFGIAWCHSLKNVSFGCFGDFSLGTYFYRCPVDYRVTAHSWWFTNARLLTRRAYRKILTFRWRPVEYGMGFVFIRNRSGLSSASLCFRGWGPLRAHHTLVPCPLRRILSTCIEDHSWVIPTFSQVTASATRAFHWRV